MRANTEQGQAIIAGHGFEHEIALAYWPTLNGGGRAEGCRLLAGRPFSAQGVEALIPSVPQRNPVIPHGREACMARVPIMDEPPAAFGPPETQVIAGLIVQLKSGGIGIFGASHDIHAATGDDLLSVAILGKHPKAGRAARAQAQASGVSSESSGAPLPSPVRLARM
ncbi:MAG TPA: hypothetical protein ENJ52_05400 [Aliiroseovarius sp.]|nr:hypothetical protein [Aliiroseovarius sp.]